MVEDKIFQFLELWKELGRENIDITFEDGKTYRLNSVELCWNVDNETRCYNP